MDEGKKICTNCQREIPSSNYTIHILHCVNRLAVCPKCKDSIPRTELNVHLENVHKEVSCERCREKIELGQLETHKKTSCCKRYLKCHYCEIEKTADDLKEHENYCGSRTELCDECGQYIMLKDQEMHLISNHVVNHKLVKENNTMATHLNDISKLKKVSNLSRNASSRSSPSKRTNDMPQINTDAGIKNKDLDKQSIQERERQLSEDLDALLAYHLTEDEDNYIASTMDDMFFHDLPGDLNMRNTLLNPNVNISDVWDDELVDNTLLENAYFDEPLPQLITSKNQNDSTSLPCEFCGCLYSADNLIQHQSGCRPDIAHGLTQELNNAVLINFELEDIPDVDKDLKNSLTVHGTIPNHAVELPCEFCGLLYPSEVLVEHQNICEINDNPQENDPIIDSPIAITAPSADADPNPSISSYTNNIPDGHKVSLPQVPKRNRSNSEIKYSDLFKKFQTLDLKGNKPTTYCKRLPQIRNVPIRISPEYVSHSLTKKDLLPHQQYANRSYNSKNDEESIAVKNYAKQVHKAMNPVRESIKNKTTGTRPKIQINHTGVLRSFENTNNMLPKNGLPKLNQKPLSTFSEQNDVPRYLIGISGAEDAYKKHLASLKSRKNSLTTDLQSSISPTQEAISSSRSTVTGRAGATPKYKAPKPPPSD